MIFCRAYMTFYEGNRLQSNQSDYSICYKYMLHACNYERISSTSLSYMEIADINKFKILRSCAENQHNRY